MPPPQIDNVTVLAAKTGPATPGQIGGGDGGQISTDMSDRLARMEEAIAGFRHSQLMLLGAVSLFALIMIGLGVYELQRLDQLNDRIADLPDKINSQMRDITKTLAESITATKQQNPQVILLPPPQQQPPNSQK